jgi:hypothetical protein
MSDEAIGTRMKGCFAQAWLVLLIVCITAALLLGGLPCWFVSRYLAWRNRAYGGGATADLDVELCLDHSDPLRQIIEHGQPLVGTGRRRRERP